MKAEAKLRKRKASRKKAAGSARPAKAEALTLDERLLALTKMSDQALQKVEKTRQAMEAMARTAEANRKSDLGRLARLEKKYAKELAGRANREADRKADLGRLARLEEKYAKELAGKAGREADRGRLARLEEKYAKELAEKKGHQRRLARALENEFAAGLPRALLATKPRIVVRAEDIRMRVRKDNNSPEFDFVAPNGELVAVGEVKTHLTYNDVNNFYTVLTVDFRKLYPEYGHLPLYGVVAGAEIDPAAVARARELGFIVLRLDGAAPHPLTARGYNPTAHPPTR